MTGVAMRFGSAAFTMLAALAPVRAQAQQPVTAFENVSVIPMDRERVLTGQTVVVERDRIVAMGPAKQVRVPTNAVRIDGHGKFLLPGLGDCHTHIGVVLTDPGVPRVEMAEGRLYALLANGVTTIRNMDYMDEGRLWPVTGAKALKLRAQVAAGEVAGPRIYTAGQWAPSQYNNVQPSVGGKENPPAPNFDSVAIYVAAYQAAGYDFLKTHEETSAMMRAVLAASRSLGLPVVGHLGRAGSDPKFSVEEALAAGMRSIEHADGYPLNSDRSSTDSVAADSFDTATVTLARATKAAGTWNCPTLHLGSESSGLAVKAFHREGARILLGSDFPLGMDVQHELEALVRHGFTPYEALVTGTKNFAEYFGTQDETGTIAVGKRADLVLLEGNPLVAIRNVQRPAGVMTAGRWFTRDELEVGRLLYPRDWLQYEFLWVYLQWKARLTMEQWDQALHHVRQFGILSDSLFSDDSVKAPATDTSTYRLLQAMTDELGAIRTIPTADQRSQFFDVFDPLVQTWLRVQRRRGYELTLPGLPSRP